LSIVGIEDLVLEELKPIINSLCCYVHNIVISYFHSTGQIEYQAGDKQIFLYSVNRKIGQVDLNLVRPLSPTTLFWFVRS
jgi:hypothetical protein